jgi:GT2 family glycosyltransferase
VLTTPVFSFIIPTRGNPESLVRLFDSISAHTSRPEEVEIVLVTDTDDEASRAVEYPGLNVRKVEGPPRRSMGSLNTAGYRAATGKYLALLNDDVVLRTPSWDDHLIDVFHNYPDGIVLAHVNDTIFRDTLCTFPFLTRAFCELAGGVSDEGYLRYRIDDHIHNIFDLLAALGHRRRIYLPEVIFEHLNLTFTERGSAYIVDPGIHAKDTCRYEALFPERKRLALDAAESIDRYARSQNQRVRKAILSAVPASTHLPDPAHASWRPTTQSPYGPARVTIAVLSADIQSVQAVRCIDLLKQHTSGYDLVIVDNNRAQGFNRASEVNRLLEFCRTDYLVLMDDDVLVESGWLEGCMAAMGPHIGVVTPAHKDQNGTLSYAGIVVQPDDSGEYSSVLGIGSRPQHIQTISGAMMLIDRNRCGHIRMDEVFSSCYGDIDFGLRVWEQGCRVVCTPWTQVTRIGGGDLAASDGRSAGVLEADRCRLRAAWVETRRMDALRGGAWQDIPEFVEMSAVQRQIDRLFVEAPSASRQDLFCRAYPLIQSLQALPALKNYIAAKARAAIPAGVARADDPKTGGWAVLLGLAGQPVLYEAGPGGVNIILQNARFYALPGGQDSLDRHEPYLFEAATPQEVREWIDGNGYDAPADEPVDLHRPLFQPPSVEPPFPGVAALLTRLSKTLPYLSSLRPRILIRRGANLFDPDYYRTTYPDIRERGANPFLHFLLYGAFEGRNPHPLFDTSFYLRRYPDVAEVHANPLGHYLKYGARENRQPHALFDPVYYLERYPDVRASGMNPLVHYVLFGAAEARQPHPWFQPDYYLEHCPERQRAARNPLLHFLQAGSKQRGAPHPQFDCEYYLRQNPGVAAVGMNPLVHYVCFGSQAGRRPSAAFHELDPAHGFPSAGTRSTNQLPPLELESKRNLEEFDVPNPAAPQDDPAAPVHVVISRGEINDQHGTGVLLKRVFRGRTGIFSIRFLDDWGVQDFGDWHAKLPFEPSSLSQILPEIRRILNGRNVKTVTCVPFTAAELLAALAVKEAFGAKLCVWIMDDQNIADDSIADDLMAECLRACSLRLTTHPELRDAYQERYGLATYILPAVVPAHLVRGRTAESIQNRRPLSAALLGSFWDQSWFDRLCSALDLCDWSTDWYGQDKSPWLSFSRDALAQARINALGIVPEDTLASELTRYPFVIVPAGALDGRESNPGVASLSLPGRILFAAATSHTPILVVGSDRSCAARFVRHFGIGEVAPYEAKALMAASHRLRNPENQRQLRSHAAALGELFSDDGVVDWLSESIELGKPGDSRFEDAFSDYKSDWIGPYGCETNSNSS